MYAIHSNQCLEKFTIVFIQCIGPYFYPKCVWSFFLIIFSKKKKKIKLPLLLLNYVVWIHLNHKSILLNLKRKIKPNIIFITLFYESTILKKLHSSKNEVFIVTQCWKIQLFFQVADPPMPAAAKFVRLWRPASGYPAARTGRWVIWCLAAALHNISCPTESTLKCHKCDSIQSHRLYVFAFMISIIRSTPTFAYIPVMSLGSSKLFI